jgi:TRAP-type C4-dicarboxylate transport system permease small subunit
MTRASRAAILRVAGMVIKAGDRLALIVVGLSLVHVVADVTLRYLTREGLPGTIDFVGNWWMPAMTFVALGEVERHGRQVEASFLRDHLDGRSHVAALVVSRVLTLIVCLALGGAGFLGATGHMMRGEAAVGGFAFPVWPARFVVPFGMLVLLLAVIVRSLEPDRNIVSTHDDRSPVWPE